MTGSERMPMLSSDDLSPAQREAVDEIRTGPRGEIAGPFIPLLRTPELLRRLQSVGAHLRYTDLAISPAVRELTVLAVARFYAQAFEWTHHLPLAIDAGVPARACTDLQAGRRPRGLPEDLQTALRTVVELLTVHQVSDETYRRAVTAFTEAGIVEITATTGYYTTLAMVMNMARTPSPSTVEFGAEHGWLDLGNDQAP